MNDGASKSIFLRDSCKLKLMAQDDPQAAFMDQGDAYKLFQKGLRLLDERHHAQAVIPLERARSLEPKKMSIREALGRAYFHAGAYEKAAAEFNRVVATHPLNDFAQFCLGRSLQKLGQRKRALHHISIASQMQPERADYRRYRVKLKTS